MENIYCYLDDVRTPLDKNFKVFRSVNSAIEFTRSNYSKFSIHWSLDHDLGDFFSEGGDAIKFLEWIEEELVNGNDYVPESVIFHTSNPVGRANMQRVWNSILRKKYAQN